MGLEKVKLILISPKQVLVYHNRKRSRIKNKELLAVWISKNLSWTKYLVVYFWQLILYQCAAFRF